MLEVRRGGGGRTIFLLAIVSGFILSGCATTLEINPVLPESGFTTQSDTRLGVYIPPKALTEEYETRLGTGIWVGTEYTFTPGPVVSEGLMSLTKRYFKNAELAENPLDKRWDWVLEFQPYRPGVEQSSFQASVPLGFAIRDTRSAKDVQEKVTLYGSSPKQPGKLWRLIGGTWVEKRHLEKTLNIGYSDLFGRVDSALARNAAKDEDVTTNTPYRRGRREADTILRSHSSRSGE